MWLHAGMMAFFVRTNWGAKILRTEEMHFLMFATDVPIIVKNPWFVDYADEVISRNDIKIEHIIVPMRNLDAAAESRSFPVVVFAPIC